MIKIWIFDLWLKSGYKTNLFTNNFWFMIIVNSQINTHLQTEPIFYLKKKLNLKTKESP